MIEFYKHEKVNNSITAIFSMTGEIMYLIEGDEKAILIDTCLGVGHLKEYVETLTDKPITVLLSHGHVDHALGAPEFTDVYMNPLDEKVYEEMKALEVRNEYIAMNLGGKLPDFLEEDYVMPTTLSYKPLSEGNCFDLGGIHIEVYAFPGHTPGSMIFLIPEQQILITGDACNNFTFLFDQNASSVKAYQKECIRLNALLKGRYQRIFSFHRQIDLDPNLLSEMIAVCDDVTSGKTDDIPFEFMGSTAYIAKALTKDMKRVDGGCANLVYDKNKI